MFFEQFEESEVKEGSLVANVEIDKRSTHIDMMIKVSGNVRISCTGVLKMFPSLLTVRTGYLLNSRKISKILIRMILSVPADANELDLQQQIYEFHYAGTADKEGASS